MRDEKQLSILYLHGLESKLSEQKRFVLERFGTVISPDLNYYENNKIFESLITLIKNETIDVIIGSSMGGFMGFHLAKTCNIPSLLFNPALSWQPVRQELNLKKFTQQQSPKVQIVLGKLDCTVNPDDTLKWLDENQKMQANTQIKIQNNMEHQIPLAVFEEEIIHFFGYFFDS
tara:strand:- start:4638 stop:5159 length:522 start_codon:yes stop_codon:yes gene_type:complete